MAKIMVFQHVPYEPLGTLDPLLRAHNHRIRYINFGRHPDSQPDISDYAALIVLGGPMNVTDIANHPYLATEIAVIQQALAANKPILGICLGSQLLAAACGAAVKPADSSEIGWYQLRPTAAATNDELLSCWNNHEMIFQWHGHTFDIPTSGTHLIEGDGCRNQAFRVGANAYGFQFHLEVTEALIQRWVSLPQHQIELGDNPLQRRTQILAETTENLPRSLTLAHQVFSRFIDLLPDVNRRIQLPSR